MHGYLNSHLAETVHVLAGYTDLKGENQSKKITYYSQASKKWERSVILVLSSWRKSNTLNKPIGERNWVSVLYRFLQNLLSLTVLAALFSHWYNSQQMKTSFLLVNEELKLSLESKSTSKNVSLAYFLFFNKWSRFLNSQVISGEGHLIFRHVDLFAINFSWPLFQIHLQF